MQPLAPQDLLSSSGLPFTPTFLNSTRFPSRALQRIVYGPDLLSLDLETLAKVLRTEVSLKLKKVDHRVIELEGIRSPSPQEKDLLRKLDSKRRYLRRFYNAVSAAVRARRLKDAQPQTDDQIIDALFAQAKAERWPAPLLHLRVTSAFASPVTPIA